MNYLITTCHHIYHLLLGTWRVTIWSGLVHGLLGVLINSVIVNPRRMWRRVMIVICVSVCVSVRYRANKLLLTEKRATLKSWEWAWERGYEFCSQ